MDPSTPTAGSVRGASRVARAGTGWSLNVGIVARTGWPSACPSSSGSGKRSRKSSISSAKAALKTRPSVSAITIFSGHCRETGEVGVVAGLTVMSCSLAEPDLRRKLLSAGGTAFAAIIAFLGFLLRAVMDSRSRSATGLPETLTSEIFRGAMRRGLVPANQAHDVVRAGLAFADEEPRERVGALAAFSDFALGRCLREHLATSTSISPLSAPEAMIFE
jgi:hypothetical protein